MSKDCPEERTNTGQNCHFAGNQENTEALVGQQVSQIQNLLDSLRKLPNMPDILLMDFEMIVNTIGISDHVDKLHEVSFEVIDLATTLKEYIQNHERYKSFSQEIHCLMHELGNILQVVSTRRELLLQYEETSEKRKSFHGKAHKTFVNGLRRIIVVMDDFNEIIHGKNYFGRSTFEILCKIAETDEVGIKIRENIEKSMVKRPVDRLQRKVISELLINAIKYHGSEVEPRNVIVSIRIEQDTYIFEVQNPGTKKLEKDKIFESGFRDPATQHMSQGTGRGLAIVKSMAQQNGGSIKYEFRENMHTMIYAFPVS